jgi:RNA polymerase sigma factor (sigma-70 family)
MDAVMNVQENEVLVEWRDFMLRTLLKRRVPRDLAEDLTQDALASAWGAQSQVRDRSAQRSWLRSIVLNRWRAHCMRLRPQEELSADPVANDGGPCRVAMRSETARAAALVLGLLHPRQAQLLLLRHGHGMAPRDMAQSFGMADGAVRHQLHAARLALLRAARTSRVRQALAAGGVELSARQD